ncbi:unnamed protein product, partial [Coregonus sp. 'balchen']
CGRHIVNLPGFGKIVGGKLAPAGSFPWQVLLSANGRGGGIVIGDRWIMTAAHVLNGNTSDEVRVASLHLHPEYNNVDDVEYDHDIALIHLQHPITFNAHVMPLCLPAKDAKYPTGRNGLVSGFGTMEFDTSTNNLMYVPLPVVNQTICRKSIEGRDERKGIPSLTDNMFCAGNPEGGKDSCQGDSGGAYVLKEGDHFWAAGIVSWGINCGEPGRYGVYSHTSSDQALQLVEPNPSTLLFHDEVQFKCESKYYTLEGDVCGQQKQVVSALAEMWEADQRRWERYPGSFSQNIPKEEEHP